MQYATTVDYNIFSYKDKLDKLRLKLKKNIEDELFIDQLDEDCSCCYFSKPVEQIIYCKYGHGVCENCLKSHAENMIFQNGKHNIICISSEITCNCLYSDKQLQKLLSKKVFEQYQKIKIKEETKYIFSMKDINLIKCQFCETYWDAEKNEELLYCRECGKTTCLKCGQIEHKGSPCDKLRIKIEENLTKQNFLICEGCRRCIEKVEGCDAVRCPCGNNMCWKCKTSWGATDAHGCRCERGVQHMNEFNGNKEAQEYIDKLRRTK